jgi:hypothetical protein
MSGSPKAGDKKARVIKSLELQMHPNNHFFGFLKLWITSQAHIEIAGRSQPVSLADDYEGMLFEGRDNALYGITRHRFSTTRLRISARP